MRGRTCRWSAVLVSAGVAFTAVVRAADDSKEAKEFKNARRGIQQQMKSRKPEARIAAVRKLVNYPTAEAAKLLVQIGLASPDDEVRKASYETLLTFKDHQGACDFLLGEVKRDMKRGNSDPGTCASLAVLLASQLEEVEKESSKLLDQAAASPEGGLLLLISLADDLGKAGDEISVSTLVKLTKSPLFLREFAVRRSVIQALAGVDQPEAVEVLIELLVTVQGEVRADIVRYLTGISGERHGLDSDAWLAWWEANREGFTFPPAAHRAVALAELGAKASSSSSYYGLPVYATRLLFVMDTSASMRGGRIEAAKRELVKAINDLPPGVYFGVLVFNSRVGTWTKDLMVASQLNKEHAAAFVQAQGLSLHTASYDALEAAFNFDTEAVYFLTDGTPYGGKIVHPGEIVEAITRLNRSRRVTINSIGIGVGAEGNVFDTFLKTLASRNYGDYERVDQ